MTTSANDTTSPSTPRRTIFGWSDLVTLRIPAEKARALADAPKPAPSIAFGSSDQVEAERAVREVHADIAAQASQQLAAQHGQREYPDGWLIEAVRDRFDDPATIALLEVIADLAGSSETTKIDDYQRRPEDESEAGAGGFALVYDGPGVESPDGADDLTAALVEVYEEWQKARPERMVPPETAKPDRAEAMRLRDAAHDYLESGEKGKAADCFDQALNKLLGPRPGALGAVVMDQWVVPGDPRVLRARDKFTSVWEQFSPLSEFAEMLESADFRRKLARNELRAERTMLGTLRIGSGLDLQRLTAWRESSQEYLERIRDMALRVNRGEVDLSSTEDCAKLEARRAIMLKLIRELSSLGVEVRR